MYVETIILNKYIMNIDDLKKRMVVTRDGHFMPLVFVDMSIPTAAVGAGCATLSKELAKQIKKSVYVSPKVYGHKFPYVSICAETADVNSLALSIDDVTF